MEEDIFEFKGDYQYLSNFFVADFVWHGIWWPHSEAAYQAAKTLDRAIQLTFTTMTPAQAKKAGKNIEMRPDWNNVKYNIMYEIVYAKFKQNPDLAAKLLSTEDAHLEEGNVWHDRIWGVYPPRSGKGKNWLGHILMDVRAELRLITEKLI